MFILNYFTYTNFLSLVNSNLNSSTDFPKEPTSTHSIFPMENYDLLNTRWEDDIIWDSENMDRIPGLLFLLFTAENYEC